MKELTQEANAHMAQAERIVTPCCCEMFKRALEEKTDAEGYMGAVWEHEGKLYTGSRHKLAPISYCPWCAGTLLPPKGNSL